MNWASWKDFLNLPSSSGGSSFTAGCREFSFDSCSGVGWWQSVKSGLFFLSLVSALMSCWIRWRFIASWPGSSLAVPIFGFAEFIFSSPTSFTTLDCVASTLSRPCGGLSACSLLSGSGPGFAPSVFAVTERSG